MHDKDESDRTVDRRRLLKRAGLVAAGAGGAVVAGAVAATPAQAASGSPVIQGQANDAGTDPTGLTAATATPRATLELANTTATSSNGVTRAGASLRLVPAGDLLSDTAPAGSLGVSTEGLLWMAHDIPLQGGGTATVRDFVFTSGTSNFTVPFVPDRVIDTRSAAGRTRILSGALDPQGRVQSGKPIVIDLSEYTANAWAVFVNLTAVTPVGDGFLTAYPTGSTLPLVSNLNYAHALFALSNYALVPVGAAQLSPTDIRDSITIFSNQTVHVIVDITAAVVSDWGSVNPAHLPGGGTAAAKANAAAAHKLTSTAPAWAKNYQH